MHARVGWPRKAGALQVEQVYDPSQAAEKLTDTQGAALPAFIVMERGDSISGWSKRAKPELLQGIAVRSRSSPVTAVCCVQLPCFLLRHVLCGR